MDITKEDVIAYLAEEGNVTELIPTIVEHAALKPVIENKVKILYEKGIADEVRNIYSKADADMEAILGERPETLDGGGRKKTYDKNKELYQELAELRAKKAEFEKAPAKGDDPKLQELFDTAKATWEKKEAELIATIKEKDGANVDFIKKSFITQELANIKFDPNTPESVRKLVLKDAETALMASSALNETGDGLVFTGEDGKVIVNDKYAPSTTKDMIDGFASIKDISLKDTKGGGAAPTKVNGGVITTNVEGKDTKKLTLPAGVIKSKSAFMDLADKTLLANGVDRNSDDFQRLKNEAYVEYKVADLPFTE